MRPTLPLLVSLVLAGLVLTVAPAAHAQFAVIDTTNIIQSTQTAFNTAQEVQNTIRQIQLMHDQIKNQMQTLQSIDPQSFAGLQKLFNESRLTYDILQTDATSIGYRVADVNRDFDALFPKDAAAWKKVHYSDYDAHYRRWNTELTDSSKIASRAQSSLLVVEKNNAAIADILRRSTSENGEVRQLQLANQQLALIHAELGSLVQTIDTISRVTANMAAASAGEHMLTREAKSRRRDGYTDRGRPSKVLSRMP